MHEASRGDLHLENLDVQRLPFNFGAVVAIAKGADTDPQRALAALQQHRHLRGSRALPLQQLSIQRRIGLQGQCLAAVQQQRGKRDVQRRGDLAGGKAFWAQVLDHKAG